MWIGRGLRRLVGAVALGCAAAQAQPLMAPESAAVACLTPPPEQRPKIVYPPTMFERREGGTVVVEMDFDAPDRPPRLDFERSFGANGRAMADALIDHLLALRMPCLTAPVQLRQEFVFVPNDGRKVVWTEPQEKVRPGSDGPFGCITGLRPMSDSTGGWGKVEQATVLLHLRFVAPDRPPEVRVVVPAPAAAMTEAAVEHVRDYRLPCHAGKPVEAEQAFLFRISGGRRTLLADAGLVDFLRTAKDVARRPVFFDFKTMDCPFEVRLELWQPHRRNNVGEVGAPNPARRAFLDWLGGLALDLKPRDLNAVLGQSMTITVPCGTLDL